MLFALQGYSKPHFKVYVFVVYKVTNSGSRLSSRSSRSGGSDVSLSTSGSTLASSSSLTSRALDGATACVNINQHVFVLLGKYILGCCHWIGCLLTGGPANPAAPAGPTSPRSPCGQENLLSNPESSEVFFSSSQVGEQSETCGLRELTIGTYRGTTRSSGSSRSERTGLTLMEKNLIFFFVVNLTLSSSKYFTVNS